MITMVLPTGAGVFVGEGSDVGVEVKVGIGVGLASGVLVGVAVTTTICGAGWVAIGCAGWGVAVFCADCRGIGVSVLVAS